MTAATDPHGDHQAAAVMTSEVPWTSSVSVMHYPVWTYLANPQDLPREVPAGYRVDIQAQLVLKRRAIAAHRTQHGQVVRDAREAFALSAALIEHVTGPTETLIWPA